MRDIDTNIDIVRPDCVEVDTSIELQSAVEVQAFASAPITTLYKIESISKNGEELPIEKGNVNIPVPTKVSELENDSQYVNSETLGETVLDIYNTVDQAAEEYVQEVRQYVDNKIGDIEGEIDELADNVDDISSKIPVQASSSNQLADKEFVNSSISTNTATFRGTFSSAWDFPSTATNNDYVFLRVVDSVTSLVTRYDRYKWNGTQWEYEYTLNNSSFTAAQWEAINSGATSSLISRLQDFNPEEYLKLTGGTITGDITFQGQPNEHQYIKFFKDATGLYNFAIRNPYGGGQIDMGYWNRTRNSYIEGIRIGYRSAIGRLTLNIIGGLLYGGNTNDESTRYQMCSDIYKQGIVSQTQTWSGSGTTGYSYTMSNQVTGNIPIMFIELVEELGAVFNETTSYFELNGLTDISYNEMKKIYTMSGANISSNNWTGMFRASPLRTNIFNYPTATSFGNCTMSNMFAYSNLEVANIVPLTKLSEWTTDDIAGANSFMQYLGSSGYAFPASTQSGNAFKNSERLKHIRGIIRYGETSTNFTNMFNLCYSLETVWLYKHNHNTDFSWSPKLKLDTIQFIVNNRSTASTASAFTITLHPTTYATCQADTTEYTYSGQTYTGIIAYAAARNITLTY